MKKILNMIFYTLQLILLVAAFALTLYVILQMNHRLNKGFMTTIDVFIPFILLFVLLIVNLMLNQKSVRNNIFYNLTSVITFLVIIVVALRALFDHNLIVGSLNSYHIDFTYFANFLPFLKILLYGLCIGNFLFMFHLKEEKKKK